MVRLYAIPDEESENLIITFSFGDYDDFEVTVKMKDGKVDANELILSLLQLSREINSQITDDPSVISRFQHLEDSLNKILLYIDRITEEGNLGKQSHLKGVVREYTPKLLRQIANLLEKLNTL